MSILPYNSWNLSFGSVEEKMNREGSIRMIICKRSFYPVDHLQEVFLSCWSFTRGVSILLIICNRLIHLDDNLQEASHSRWSFARGRSRSSPHTWHKSFLLIKGFHKLFEQTIFYGIYWNLTNKSDQWMNVIIEVKTIYFLLFEIFTFGIYPSLNPATNSRTLLLMHLMPTTRLLQPEIILWRRCLIIVRNFHQSPELLEGWRHRYPQDLK